MTTHTIEPANPGARYSEIFEGRNAVAAGAAPSKGGIADRVRDRLVREEWMRLAKRGWEAVELINYHPWPIRVDLGELGIISIPAAAGSHGSNSITAPRISMRDLGDGNFVPVSVLPTELAQEVEREYARCGGVVWHVLGEDIPEAAVEQARARQMAWYREEYRKAVHAWSRYRQHQFITERQRDAAKALASAGEIAYLPEWVTLTRDAGERTTCPDCGEEIKPTARICRFCHRRLASNAGSKAAASESSPARRSRSKGPLTPPFEA